MDQSLACGQSHQRRYHSIHNILTAFNAIKNSEDIPEQVKAYAVHCHAYALSPEFRSEFAASYIARRVELEDHPIRQSIHSLNEQGLANAVSITSRSLEEVHNAVQQNFDNDREHEEVEEQPAAADDEDWWHNEIARFEKRGLEDDNAVSEDNTAKRQAVAESSSTASMSAPKGDNEDTLHDDDVLLDDGILLHVPTLSPNDTSFDEHDRRIYVDDYPINDDDKPFPCNLSPIIPPGSPEGSKGLDDSFVSDTYHVSCNNLHLYDSIEPWPSCTTNWMIGDFDVISELKTFWEVSSHLATTQGNISDIRILALHRIFPFLINQKESITMYIDHHDDILNELKLLTSGCPSISSDLILWCHSLTTTTDKWAIMKKKCLDIMNMAYEKGDDTDILATNILFNIAPRIARKRDTYLIEDTFIHLYLDSLLDDMFSTEEIFYQSANSSLESSTQMKPDWLNYIRPWHMKIDITTCEVKPPSKQGNCEHSDFVKLGLEMRGMLNKMLDIIEVEDAMVFGILVEGYHFTTYAMDLKAQVYRMIQLGSCNLMSQQSDLGAFPALFHCLLQVKTLAVIVANKIRTAQLERAKGKRKNPDGPIWRSNDLMKTTKKKDHLNSFILSTCIGIGAWEIGLAPTGFCIFKRKPLYRRISRYYIFGKGAIIYRSFKKSAVLNTRTIRGGGVNRLYSLEAIMQLATTLSRKKLLMTQQRSEGSSRQHDTFTDTDSQKISQVRNDLFNSNFWENTKWRQWTVNTFDVEALRLQPSISRGEAHDNLSRDIDQLLKVLNTAPNKIEQLKRMKKALKGM
ncbi:hypothetical protein RO3G_15572 [Lichtheimia corymbifera JMRC:FSU:9682]|uniref:Uncharacterized protein n=1 Tax=Lichtheimia corymbifera JMRC:FSU:9682 TaxID=1263082 RepID=A0A068RQ56_9FUNG|nr:hypothetical protein RO3G_15572 [Lichtheimia corymbifera JMRC:FSU:9682]